MFCFLPWHVAARDDSGAAEGACPLAGEAHAPAGVSVGGNHGLQWAEKEEER